MTDAEIFNRLTQLEKDAAVLLDRSGEHSSQIRAFGPLVREHDRLDERVQGLQRGLDGLRADTDNFAIEVRRKLEALNSDLANFRLGLQRDLDERDERDEQRDKERTRFRWTTYIAMSGLLLTAAGTVYGILTIGAHP